MINPAVLLFLILALTGGLMLLVLGSLLRSGLPGIRDWFRGSALISLGVFSLMLPASPATGLVLWLANGMVMLGLTLLYFGCRRFVALMPVDRRWMGLLAVVMLGLAWLSYGQDEVEGRIVLVSIYMGMVCVALAGVLARHGQRTYSHRYTTYLAAVMALGYFARVLVYAVGLDQVASLVDPTAWNLAFISLGVLGFPALTIGLIMLVHDRMLSDSETIANIDYLTDLSSRKAFFERLEQELRRTQRSGLPLTLLLVDIDYFKRINDGYGHAAGDRVLVHFARHSRQVKRQQDVAGRIGGEEFALLFPDSDLEAGRTAAERLLNVIRETPCETPNGRIHYTFSGGLAMAVPGESVEAWVARADAALYRAKQGGRNGLALADTDALPVARTAPAAAEAPAHAQA